MTPFQGLEKWFGRRTQGVALGWNLPPRWGWGVDAGALLMALCFLCCLLFHPAARAQSSATSISFQGVLNGANGLPVPNNVYNLTFQFWNHPTGTAASNRVGSAATVTNVPVTNGLASTAIPVGPATFDGSTRWLGITVTGQNGGHELAPRILVTAVPYAMGFSGEQLKVGAATDFVLPGYQLQVAGSRADILLQDSEDATPGAFWTLESEAYSSGNFGILRWPSPTSAIPSLTVREDGRRVGIGARPQDFNGSSQLQIVGEFADIMLQNTRGSGFWTIESDAYRQRGDFGIIHWDGVGLSPKPHLLVSTLGNVGLGTHTPQTKLDVNGTTRTRILQITGGSDLAEPFDVTRPNPDTDIQPGMVMVIDRERDGKLTPCTHAYDTAVAGIISGANGLQPGMVMQAEGQPHAEGEHPIAMTGRVWCWADASTETGSGPVKRGDRLTTSRTLGHAMRISDESRAPGAVIGKALTELREGKGLVLVLVNLQ